MITNEVIIYQDEVLLVVNKPAGLPCQSTDNPDVEHLFGALSKLLKGAYLAIHHRLDSPTSGLMIFSKSQKFNRQFTNLFRDRLIQKSYLAKVWTENKCPQKWENSAALKKIRKGRHLICRANPKGDEALSRFKLLEQYEDCALIECLPKTGRMHQLRVHLADDGFPVVGDWLYGKKSKQKRMMLHAWKLDFPHPKTNEMLHFEAPVPDDFEWKK